jgi:hypothetical protein
MIPDLPLWGWWLVFGYFGWLALMNFRTETGGNPKDVPIIGYVNGFTLALLLGPICFLLLTVWGFVRWSNLRAEKAQKARILQNIHKAFEGTTLEDFVRPPDDPGPLDLPKNNQPPEAGGAIS